MEVDVDALEVFEVFEAAVDVVATAAGVAVVVRNEAFAEPPKLEDESEVGAALVNAKLGVF